MSRVKDTETFKTKAIAIHEGLYTYEFVDYIGTNDLVIITCSVHGNFKQTPASHLQGSGCSKCAGNERLTVETFIAKAIEVHAGKYTYGDIFEYINYHTPLTITCNVNSHGYLHGNFEQTPASHLQGSGCPKCSPTALKTNLKFIEDAIEVHGYAWDYSKVQYVNSGTKVIIICNVHKKEFEQTPASHLKGSGCGECSKKIRMDIAKFEAAAKLIYNKKYAKYDYGPTTFRTYGDQVEIICNVHGEKFRCYPRAHLNGIECGKCMPHPPPGNP